MFGRSIKMGSANNNKERVRKLHISSPNPLFIPKRLTCLVFNVIPPRLESTIKKNMLKTSSIIVFV